MTAPAARSTGLHSSTFINEMKTSKKKKRSTNTNNPFKNPKPNTKHLYYDESGEITTTTAPVSSCSPAKKEAKVDSKIIFRCSLNDMDGKKPRIFQIQTKNVSLNKCNKENIEIRENIVLSPVDVQTILNKSKVYDATSQEEMYEEVPAKTSHPSPENDKQEDINKKESKQKLKEDNSSDEGNCSLNESNCTARTTIDKYKEASISTSNKLAANETNGNDSLATNKTNNDHDVSMNQTKDNESLQTNKANGDKDLSVNQTTNSAKTDTSILKDANESSVVSVDCVDLSIDLDDDDDCKTKSDEEAFKKPQDVSNYDSSDVEEVSEVIDLNESEEPSIVSTSFNKSNSIKLNKIMPFCTKMTQLPEIGDIVVFKVITFLLFVNFWIVGLILCIIVQVPYLTKKGFDCNTEFLAGEAQYINKRTKSIKILIKGMFSVDFFIFKIV